MRTFRNDLVVLLIFYDIYLNLLVFFFFYFIILRIELRFMYWIHSGRASLYFMRFIDFFYDLLLISLFLAFLSEKYMILLLFFELFFFGCMSIIPALLFVSSFFRVFNHAFMLKGPVLKPFVNVVVGAFSCNLSKYFSSRSLEKRFLLTIQLR